MPEPKQKLTRSRTRKRRGTLSVKAPALVECHKCKSKILPHHVCPICGTYKNRQILEVKTKVTKKIREKKEKNKKDKDKE